MLSIDSWKNIEDCDSDEVTEAVAVATSYRRRRRAYEILVTRFALNLQPTGERFECDLSFVSSTTLTFAKFLQSFSHSIQLIPWEFDNIDSNDSDNA